MTLIHFSLQETVLLFWLNAFGGLSCYISVIQVLVYRISSITVHAPVPELVLTPLALISKKRPRPYRISALYPPDNFLKK